MCYDVVLFWSIVTEWKDSVWCHKTSMSSEPFSPLCCKERHNITACICMERRKNPWFECDQWYCNRPNTNVSQVMHNLKRYPEFRCIDSDRDAWDSNEDHIGINIMNQGSLSAFFECITIMHKHLCISFLMIARSKRTYIMYVCPGDILFGMMWSPACPFLHGFTICMERNANGSALFLFSLRNSHQMCDTHILSNHLLIPLPHWVLVSLKFQAVFLTGVHPHYIALVNPLQTDFYIR